MFPRLVSGTTSPESATTTTLKVPAAAGNGAESDPVYDAPLASPPVWVTRPSNRSPAFTVPSVEEINRVGPIAGRLLPLVVGHLPRHRARLARREGRGGVHRGHGQVRWGLLSAVEGSHAGGIDRDGEIGPDARRGGERARGGAREIGDRIGGPRAGGETPAEAPRR